MPHVLKKLKFIVCTSICIFLLNIKSSHFTYLWLSPFHGYGFCVSRINNCASVITVHQCILFLVTTVRSFTFSWLSTGVSKRLYCQQDPLVTVHQEDFHEGCRENSHRVVHTESKILKSQEIFAVHPENNIKDLAIEDKNCAKIDSIIYIGGSFGNNYRPRRGRLPE